jgi:hypothetical protein
MTARGILLAAFIALGLIVFVPQARSAVVAGSVTDPQHTPVTPAHVTVKNQSGIVVGSADANSQGQYSISHIPTGQYKISLALPRTKYLGQTIQSGVQPEGLCLDWTVSHTARALATGRPGASLATCMAPVAGATGRAGRLATDELLGLGIGLIATIAGGTVGGLAAAGYWSGGGDGGGGGGAPKPASPGL